MASGIATSSKMTAEDFLIWGSRPENVGRRCELENGEIIDVPPPKHPHGIYCWLVIKILTEYIVRRGAGYMCTNDTGMIVQRNPDTVRGADAILFLQTKSGEQINPGYIEDIPNLVVEVLSPDDRPGKTNRRIEQYLRRGIPLVWLIDPEERIVTVYRPKEFHKVLDVTEELTGNGVLPDFSCRVSDLFTIPGQQPAAPDAATN
jgi:Uma2 family endonuclease